MSEISINRTKGLPWTDEREKLLTELWGHRRIGTAEIAATIGGVTKNAVIGKARRLGLPHRHQIGFPERLKGAAGRVKRAPAPRPEIEPNPPGMPLPQFRRFNGDRIQPTKPAVKLPQSRIYFDSIEAKLIPKKQRKTVFELRNDTCRWPFNHPCDPDFFFCGAPEANLESGKPYCPEHSAIAHMRGQSQ